MTTDPDRRTAARVALVVALPVALAVGLASLWSLGAVGRAGADATPNPTPSTSPVSTPATGKVALPAPSLAPPDAVTCRALLARLPESVRDRARRPVSGPEQNAAYGDPPLTLACGGPAPSVDPTELVYPISGTCWVSRVTQGGTEWHTVDRTVPVTVVVPGEAAGSAQWVAALSPTVAAAVPRLAEPPTGCG